MAQKVLGCLRVGPSRGPLPRWPHALRTPLRNNQGAVRQGVMGSQSPVANGDGSGGEREVRPVQRAAASD